MVVIALCAAAAGGAELRRLQRTALSQLSAAANAKAGAVASWRAERLADARAMAADPLPAQAALRAQAPGAGGREREALEAWARSRLEGREYRGAVVVGATGEVIASAGQPEGAAHAVEALRGDGAAPSLLDPHEDEEGALHVAIVAPLRVGDAPPVGAVVLRIDPSVHLLALVDAYEPELPESRALIVESGTGRVLWSPRAGGDVPVRETDASELEWFDAAAPLAVMSPVPGSSWSIAIRADGREIPPRFAQALWWLAALAAALFGVSVAVALIWRGHQLAAHARRCNDTEQERVARERIEVALRESEDKFRAAFFGSRVGTALFDAEGRFLEFNDALAAMLGFDSDELHDRRFRELVHPDDTEGCCATLTALVSGERDHVDQERRLVRKDGRVIHARYSVSVIHGETGAFGAALAVIQDATDEVRALAELRTSEERLRLALEATSDVIFDWDVARDAIHVSPRSRGTLASDLPSPTTARDFAALIHPSERAELQAIVADVVAGRRQGFELEHRARSGAGWSWVRTRAKAVAFDGSGAALRVVGACNDVSERRDLQAQLLVADRMASIGTVAAGIAHEVSNPLAYLVANLAFAREAVSGITRSCTHAGAVTRDPRGVELADTFAALREALDDAHEGAERVRRIVTDVKKLSRSDEATLPVDVPAVLESSLAIARPDITRRAALVRRIAPVPPVVGNEGRLGQVFLNLLVNAAQALPEDDPAHNEIRVTTAADASGRVVVEIADTGCGIPPEILGRVFDPFFTTKPPGIGTGLGLAISRGIVASLGGEIQVETEVGAGSTFRVLLPAFPAAPAGSPSPAPG